MIALLLATIVSSLFIAWAAGFAVRRWALRLGLVDRPGSRKVHQVPTPLGGGVAIWLGVVVPLSALQVAAWAIVGARNVPSGWAWVAQLPWPLLLVEHAAGIAHEATRLWALIGAATLLAGLGLIDDRRGLDWRARIVAEFLVAGVMAACGWRFSLFVDWPWLSAIVSTVWIVALINSFNWLDNMDCLSGGVAAIASAVLAAVMLLAPETAAGGPQLFVGGLLLLLLGALLGFLWHNRPPARLFMGDAGAYFLGFLLAIATIAATFAGESAPRHAIFAPLCVLAVPLYDMLSVLSIRIRQGRSPFQPDKSHFSHRLVELGLSKPQAALVIHLATITTALGALLLYQVDAFGAGVILVMVVATLSLVAILEAVSRQSRNPERGPAAEKPSSLASKHSLVASRESDPMRPV